MPFPSLFRSNSPPKQVPEANSDCAVMQFAEDHLLPPEQQQWLRCDIDAKAEDVCIVLARRDMLETAVRRGAGGPIFMDATHGLQKYGFKLVTVHVVDEESSGESSGDTLPSWFLAILLRPIL